MPQDHGADAIAPHQHAPAPGKEHADCQENGRDHVVFVQPAQLGILIEIANQFCLCVVIAIGQDPAHMRLKKAAQRGRMQILVRIRMAMMMAVIGGPPKHTLLRGHGGHKRHHELKRAARLK